jgi:hypothetical protein
MRRILLLTVLCISILVASAQSRQIAFTGWNEYSIDFGTNTGNIKVGKVTNNRSGGKSGTLFVQVWLFNQPYANYSISGYKIADINIGELNGGWEFRDMQFPISWDIAVPAGTYNVAFLLVEYNPKPGGDYWTEDYLNFNQTATKNRPETRDDAVQKLISILSKANQQSFSETYSTTTVLAQRLSLSSIRIEKRENDKKGKITQEWRNVPWASLYTIDGYASAVSGSDVLMLSLKFDEVMDYSFTVEGVPDAKSDRKDLRQINIYIRRSDHAEAVRLLNLIADSYY